jgi:hypothetical protein
LGVERELEKLLSKLQVIDHEINKMSNDDVSKRQLAEPASGDNTRKDDEQPEFGGARFIKLTSGTFYSRAWPKTSDKFDSGTPNLPEYSEARIGSGT